MQYNRACLPSAAGRQPPVQSSALSPHACLTFGAILVRQYLYSMVVLAIVLGCYPVQHASATEKLPEPPVPPTAAGVHYGPHERQVLDFWQAKSDKPTPLALIIHSGGWIEGDKSQYFCEVPGLLDHGISVAAINYRLIAHAKAQQVVPPVKAPLEDARRALQFLRSKAAEWNIDQDRIGAMGDSAGGFSALWLALHDDMADPNSADPVARESTRLCCASVFGAQVTLDPTLNLQWLPNFLYGAHAFGLPGINDAVRERERLLPWIHEYSPYDHVSNDDPPIGLYYFGVKGAKVGERHQDATHSPILGLKLAEKLREHGVKVTFQSNSTPPQDPPSMPDFLIRHLQP